MRATLERIARRYRLWFISGRDAEEAQRIVAVTSAGYIGAHGLEALDENGLRPLTDVAELSADLARLTASVLADVPEAAPFVERKRWSVAFHYRQLERPNAVAGRLERCITQHLPEGLRLLPGKMVYEVLPYGQYDKGTAIDWLIDTFQPRRVLAAGDDVTDLPMLRRLAGAAAIERLTIAIRHGRETPAGLLEHADLVVDGSRALEDILTSML